MKKKYIFAAIGLSAIAIITIAWLAIYKGGEAIPEVKPVFAGHSQNLAATKIVPVLDAALDRQTNVIWCASFLAAWKALEAEVVNEQPSLQGSPQVALALNNQSDPGPHIPKDSLYAAAGWQQKGITKKIAKDLAQMFPDKSPPAFPGIAQQDIQFSLNRSGAELKAEEKIHMVPIPTYYVFDRPFLLLMKKRGAKMPYFVMWVENAELLNKWQALSDNH